MNQLHHRVGEWRFGRIGSLRYSIILTVLVLLAVGLFWQFWVSNTYGFSSPTRIWSVFISDYPKLFLVTVQTSEYVLTGLFVGGVLGFSCGIVLGLYNQIPTTVGTLLAIVLAFPKTSVYLIISSRYGVLDDTGIYVIIAYVSFVFLCYTGFHGVRQIIDDRMQTASRLHRAVVVFRSRWGVAFHYILPMMLPMFFTNLRYIAIILWPFMIFAEPFGFPSAPGLGNYVYDSYESARWDHFFAGSIMFMFCGTATAFGIEGMKRLIMKKY